MALEKRLKSVRRTKDVKSIFIRAIITASFVYLMFNVVFTIAVVNGDSMMPALKEGDILLFLNIGVNYRAGDIALIKSDDGTEYVKRIIAVPNQTVNIDDVSGEVVINENVLKEPYIYQSTYSKSVVTFPITLGEDEYFVLGDNRANSKDSRNYGSINSKNINGKLVLLLRW